MADEEISYPALSGRGWDVPVPWRGDEPLPEGFAYGDFLVGRLHCGRGLDPSVAAVLRASGVAAVIATSIDPDFFAAALAAGLPALAIEEAAAIKSGDRLRVDIETFRVANRNSGDRYIVKNLDDVALDVLRRASVQQA